ncbi:MAG TPA: UDP-N-acetylmuramate--L-alanine ligase [Dehalococcoidia bacterium]
MTTASRRAESSAIPQRVHLVGIGGMHMSAIAQILLHRGHQVSGSDLRPSDLTRRLAALGATVYEGHHAHHVDDAGLLVATAAAREDNPEIQEARRRGIPVLVRDQMVARLLEGRRAVAVAGTHGKTTTTSMVAVLLKHAGLDPTYLLGGESVDLGGNAAPGDGPYVVVEADEYKGAFLSYRPEVAVVLNVEPDHLDYYGTPEQVSAAFRRFLANVPPEGRLVVCADSPGAAALLAEPDADPPLAAREVHRYGLSQPAEWTADDVEPNDLGGHRFTVRHHGRPAGRFQLRVPGLHNVSNALAAVVVGLTLGVEPAAIQEALAGFRGARRRFELLGEAGGVTVVDDYAHHPTEVRATLQAARRRFPGRRLVGIFQPHTYSRTRYLLDGFRGCFADLDELIVAETYAAREGPEAGIGARELAERVERPRARYAATLEEAARMALEIARPGDVIFTLGAGDVNQAGPAILEGLRSG